MKIIQLVNTHNHLIKRFYLLAFCLVSKLWLKKVTEHRKADWVNSTLILIKLN